MQRIGVVEESHLGDGYQQAVFESITRKEYERYKSTLEESEASAE